MIVYMYLAILVVTSIITGIIVTIMERKGFYPKSVKKENNKSEVKKDKKVVTEEPVIMNAVTIMNMEPLDIELLDYEESDVSDTPVLLSSYTIDLSDVVNKVKTEGCV